MSDKDLRDAGLKITQPRVKILQILENAKPHHLSAEDVYKSLLEQGEDIGLATVYRVLTQFEAAKIIVRHNFGSDRFVFEINTQEHHDHIICLHCDKVMEFVNEVIEQQQEAMAIQLGFKMTGHSLIIYGICEQCQQKK